MLIIIVAVLIGIVVYYGGAYLANITNLEELGYTPSKENKQ